MLARQLQYTLINSVLTAAHLALAAVVYAAESTWLRVAALIAICAASLIAWLAAFRRYHAIVDTPTSQIRSATQGYVELHGETDLLPGAKALGPLAAPPCVWYRYRVYRREEGIWNPIESGQSDDTFLLRDVSGECVIDPDFAEVTTTNTRTTERDNYRTVMHYLVPGEPLYAIGELQTLRTATTTADVRADVSALLGEWKRSPAMLLERFDSNRDGEVDLTEWQQARRAAREEVSERHREMRLAPDTHLMRAPHDGRPYLLSNRDPQRLAQRFRYWAWFHGAVFAATLVISLVLLGG